MLNDKVDNNDENSKYSKFLGYSNKKLDFSKLDIESDVTIENIMDKTSNNFYNNIFVESLEQKNQRFPTKKEKLQKETISTQKLFENQLKLGSEISENYDKCSHDSSRYNKPVDKISKNKIF